MTWLWKREKKVTMTWIWMTIVKCVTTIWLLWDWLPSSGYYAKKLPFAAVAVEGSVVEPVGHIELVVPVGRVGLVGLVGLVVLELVAPAVVVVDDWWFALRRLKIYFDLGVFCIKHHFLGWLQAEALFLDSR